MYKICPLKEEQKHNYVTLKIISLDIRQSMGRRIITKLRLRNHPHIRVNEGECGRVRESAGECGRVRESAGECGIDTTASITVKRFDISYVEKGAKNYR